MVTGALWWSNFLQDELTGVADVTYEARPDIPARAGDAPATVTIAPTRPGSLALSVTTGMSDAPVILFGTVAECVCAGVPSSRDAGGLDPSNHLGVMVAAVVSDGAILLQHRRRRRTLALGPLALHERVSRQAIVQEWLPYGDAHDPLTLFRRPPAYAEMPTATFLVPAFHAPLRPESDG